MLPQAREPPRPENGCSGREPNPLETDLQSVTLAAICHQSRGGVFSISVSNLDGDEGTLTRLSRAIIAAHGFIEPGARASDGAMGFGPQVPLAVLLALVSAAPVEGATVASAYRGRSQTRGATVVQLGGLAAFLRMNPEERFDLEAINTIDLQALVEEARGEKELLREVMRRAKALLPRVRAETEGPLLVGAILRLKTLDWYRRSPSDPSWVEEMPLRWGGIFHESREPGGRLSRKLSARLASLIAECVKAGGAGASVRASVTGFLRSSASAVPFGKGSKRPHQSVIPQVAQAYLEELAANGRNGDQPLPLERLSGLARRIGSAEVNRTLGELFPQDGAGSLTVLDQRFHPDMNTWIIRVVPPKASDDAATYDLVQPNAHPLRESGALDVATTEAGPNSHWERKDMTKDDWFGLLRSFEKRKARMAPPPRENYRDRESYLGLRELILADTSARRAFLAVRWRGKPSGLALLCQLLSEGTLAPEVETDGDYLEAELEHLDNGHADRRPKDGQWKVGHGWTVVREVAEGNVRTYRADGTSTD